MVKLQPVGVQKMTVEPEAFGIRGAVKVVADNRMADSGEMDADLMRDAGFHLDLTGRENLVLVARLRHLKGARQIADGLLARFQLTDAAQRRVSTYSGGMRRRLDIAMSLIGNPPVIFLDEPTTGLDPESRLEVWNSVRELAGRGTTVLLCTQYLDEAEQLADRIAILHQGRIIANGTLAELKQLLPPAQVEYVEKQPTLEDIFLAITGSDGNGSNDRTKAKEQR